MKKGNRMSLPELLSAGEPEPSEPVVQMEVPPASGEAPAGTAAGGQP